MKYLNSIVFLGMMLMVTGCQKKEKSQPKKAAQAPMHHTKKSDAMKKHEPKKMEHKAVAHKKAPIKQTKIQHPEVKKAPAKKADHNK